MKFNDWANSQILLEGVLENKLKNNIRPELVSQVMNILDNNTGSPLVKHIVQRVVNPDKAKKYTIKKDSVGTLEIYKLDPSLFEQLLTITAGDIGPGEILIGLTMGHWEGGTGGDFDVLLPEIGKVEIKYLGPFAKSTNVPFGSGYDRRIADTDFEKLITSLYNIARTDPNIIRQLLTEAEASYFFGKTFGQLYEDNNNLTTKSLRLIGRLLRNSDSKGGKLKENGLTFERMKLSMEKCLKDAIGEAQYILFLGERTDPNSEGVILKGQYYLMPREKVKYWMFYRIYKNDRIKIAPFSTEKDFIEKTVKEKKMEEAPLIRSYRGEHDGILGSDVDNYDPSLVIPKYEIPTMEDEYTKGDISIKSINDGDEIRYGLFVKQNLASVIDLISFELDGVDPKKFRPYQVVNVITKKEFRRKGYAKQLYSFVLNNHKVIVSDSIVYKNSQEIWDSFISTIAERFNYDKEANKFSEYNPINDENIVYVAFSKTKYPIEELPNK